MDSKITLLVLYQQEVELRIEVALDPVVGIVGGFVVHPRVLKPVPINSALPET